MCVPDVHVLRSSLGHQHLVAIPDAVATVTSRGSVSSAGSDPDDLVMPGLAATVGNFSVPFVVNPGTSAGLRSVQIVAGIPGRVPLHDEVVVCVGSVAPDHSVHDAVDAVCGSHEDAGRVVVAELVKPAGGRDCRDDAEHGNQRNRAQDDNFLEQVEDLSFSEL